MGTPLGPQSPAYASVMGGAAYFGEAVIVGTPYYTAYQPITDHAGKPVGILYVGVDKARVDGVVLDMLKLLVGVGAAVLVALGLAGFFIARKLIGGVPKLAKTMNVIAGGDYEAKVPYADRTHELGLMAKAVEVFRDNCLKVASLTEEERAASERRRIERTDMMVACRRPSARWSTRPLPATSPSGCMRSSPMPSSTALPVRSICWSRRSTAAWAKPGACSQRWPMPISPAAWRAISRAPSPSSRPTPMPWPTSSAGSSASCATRRGR